MSPRDHLRPPTILIADDDLGFVVWLALTLNAAGYAALPATRVSEALRVLDELDIETLDLLIVNPASDGSTELLETLRDRQASLAVIRIGEEDHGAADSPGSASEWIRRVEQMLRRTRSAGPFS